MSFTDSSPRRCPSPSLPDSPPGSASPSPSPSSTFSPTKGPAVAAATRAPLPPSPAPSPFPSPFPSRAGCLFSPSSSSPSSSSASTSPPPLSSSSHASPSSAAAFPRSTSSSPAFASSPHPCPATSAGPKFPPPVSASPRNREPSLNHNGNQLISYRVPAGRNLNAQYTIPSASSSADKPTVQAAGQSSAVRQPSKLPASSKPQNVSGSPAPVQASPASSSNCGGGGGSNGSEDLSPMGGVTSPQGQPILTEWKREQQQQLQQQEEGLLLSPQRHAAGAQTRQASTHNSMQQQQQQQQQQQAKNTNQPSSQAEACKSSDGAQTGGARGGVAAHKASAYARPVSKGAAVKGTPQRTAGKAKGPLLLVSQLVGQSAGRASNAHHNTTASITVSGPGAVTVTQGAAAAAAGVRARAGITAAPGARAAASAARARAGGPGVGRGRGMGSGGCKPRVQLSLQVGVPSPGVWSVPGSEAAAGAGVAAGGSAAEAARGDSAAEAERGSGRGSESDKQQSSGQILRQPTAKKQTNGQTSVQKQPQQQLLQKATPSNNPLQQQPPPPFALPAFLPPPLTCPSLPSSTPRPLSLHTRSTSISTPMGLRPPLSRDPPSPSLSFSHSLSTSVSPTDRRLGEGGFGGRGRGSVRPLVLGKVGLGAAAAGSLQSARGWTARQETVGVDNETMQGRKAVLSGGEAGGRSAGGAAGIGGVMSFGRGTSAAAASANEAVRYKSASTKVAPSNGVPPMLSRSMSAPLSALRAMPPNAPYLRPTCLPPSTSSDNVQHQQHQHQHGHNTSRINQHSSSQQQHRRSPSQVLLSTMSPGARPLRPGAPSPRSISQASNAGRARAEQPVEGGNWMERGRIQESRVVEGAGTGTGGGVEQQGAQAVQTGSGGEEASVERPKAGLGLSQERMLRSSRSSNALLLSPTPASLLHQRCSLPARSTSCVKPLTGLLGGGAAARKSAGEVMGRKGTERSAVDAAAAAGGLEGVAGGNSGGDGCGRQLEGGKQAKPGEECHSEAGCGAEAPVGDGDGGGVVCAGEQLVEVLVDASKSMEVRAAAVNALLLLVTEHRGGLYAAWKCGAVPALLSLARSYSDTHRKQQSREVHYSYETMGDGGAEAVPAGEMAANIARILMHVLGDAPSSHANDAILHDVAWATTGMLGSRVQGMDAHVMSLLTCLSRQPHGQQAIADVAGIAAALVEVVEGPCVRARGAAVKMMRELVVGGFLSAVALVGEGALPPLARISLSLGEGPAGEVMKKGVEERELIKNARALLFLLKESVWQGEADAIDDSF
ncbi:hypothetical protein CLOM_g8941 [Closterium sp. NIES-68]|nr:hypothetical protein CLOM_g8941 [Closterium sp. NIES-68]GJP84848.1 hypothetical protein CLOP_g14897 [Closterium sp. NIES-67]